MAIVTTQRLGISQFGPALSSRFDEEYTIFGLQTGLKDLVGEATLQQIADALPLVEYDPNERGGNFLRFDSPNLNVPGFGSYDLKGFLGFGIDVGLHLHIAYDFGAIDATATIDAPRVDHVVTYNSYVLDTSSTRVTAAINSFAGTQPFNLKLYIGGADGGDGTLSGGIIDAGVYKNGQLRWTDDLGFDAAGNEPLNFALIDTGDLFPGQNSVFGTDSLYGEIGVPQLPALSLTAGGMGASAVYGGGQANGTGPEFAALHIKPLEFIPAFDAINSNDFNFITSDFLDAGLSYNILDLDVSLSAALRQDLRATVESVAITAVAQEWLGEDVNGGSAERQAADAADGVDDEYVTVDTQSGFLGDTFVFGNFGGGRRDETRIVETYSITLRFDTDIDIVLQGGVDLRFLTASFFINPILIDELRFGFGPLFQAGFSFDIAAIDVFSDSFTVTLDVATIEHTISTIVDFVGTPNADTLALKDTGQANIDALGGNDFITGTTAINVIDGGAGDDILSGQASGSSAADNDILRGGTGWDLLTGGNGNDLLLLGAGGTGSGADDAYGQNGDDTIIGSFFRGQLNGGQGNDTIVSTLAFFGGQVFDGGAQVDTLILDANNGLRAFDLDFGDGSGIIIAAAGEFAETRFVNIERIDFRSGVADDRLNGTTQDDTLGGGKGDDYLSGDFGDDELFGDDGIDHVYGDEGNDELYGGADADELDGGGSNDQVYGGAGADRLGYRTNTNGVLTFGNDFGNDTLSGGDGDDTIRDTRGTNLLLGGTGDDTITGAGDFTVIFGNEGNDTLAADTGVTGMHGAEGDDFLNATFGGVASSEPVMLLATGGNGSDRILVTGNGSTVRVYGDAVENAGNAGDVDTLIVGQFAGATSDGSAPPYTPALPLPGDVTQLTASGTLNNGTTWEGFEAFEIYGNADEQYLVAGDYADRLDGGAGDDFLDGAAGLDILNGGFGDDILVGAMGDTFNGGADFDTLVFDGSRYETGGAVVRGYTLILGSVSQRLEPLTPGANTGPYAIYSERIGVASRGTVIKDVEALYMSAAGAGSDMITGAEFADRLLGGFGDDTLDGGAGSDTILGGLGSDRLRGGSGADLIVDDEAGDVPGGALALGGDRIEGGTGNDTIYASHDASLINGDSGNDIIVLFDSPGVASPRLNRIDGGQGADDITGSNYAEVLVGGIDLLDTPRPDLDSDDGQVSLGHAPAFYDAGDTIDARGGADFVYGGFGDDTLRGGDGDDRIFGESGADTIFGDAGYDVILGGSGNDTITGGLSDGLVFDDIDGGRGNDTITGSRGADILRGGDGADVINGFGNLSGSGAIERIEGNAGADRLTASGAAIVAGGNDNDQITLGSGRQEIFAQRGPGLLPGLDTVTGFTPGEDVVHFDGVGLNFEALQIVDTERGVELNLGRLSNAPRVLLLGVSARDLGAGAIVITAPPTTRPDAIAMSNNTLAAIPGAFLLSNDLGDAPTLTGVSNASGLSASFFNGQAVVGSGNANGQFRYTATNAYGSATGNVAVRVVQTSDADDVIDLVSATGGGTLDGSFVDLRGGADRLTGSTGADNVNGGAGDDTINGAGGDDTVTGGTGNDTLVGGAGSDVLVGDEGDDMLTDTSGVGTLRGGTGNDSYLIVSTALSTIVEQANGGNDTVSASQSFVLPEHVENGRLIDDASDLTGNDAGNSLLGNLVANVIHGGRGNDTIRGLDGTDQLFGDGGNDLLVGGAGVDQLYGGTGADLFIFAALESTIDRIRDFDRTALDRIDVSAIDANRDIAGDQAFTFIGGAAFASAGELRVTTFDGRGAPVGTLIVEMDVNGDRISDLSILIYPGSTPIQTDFVL